MREVAGAIERPAESRIELDESAEGTRITIPAARLPWPIYVGAVVAAASLIAVVVAGAMVFLFRLPFPGYEAVVGGRFTLQPLSWQLAGLLGWLLIVPGLLVLMTSALRLVTRREQINFPGRVSAGSSITAAVVTVQSADFVRKHIVAIPVSDILRFQLHHDPQELVESEIVVETHSALAEGRAARRLIIGTSVSEAEREWLASVLNALLAQTRNA